MVNTACQVKRIRFVEDWSHLCGHGNVSPAGVWGWTSSRSRCTRKASPPCGCACGPSAFRHLGNSSRSIRTQTGDRLPTQQRRPRRRRGLLTPVCVEGSPRPSVTPYGAYVAARGQAVPEPFVHMHIKPGSNVLSDFANVVTRGHSSWLSANS